MKRGILICLVVFLLIVPSVSADAIMPFLPYFYSFLTILWFIPVVFLEGAIAYFLFKRYKIKFWKSILILFIANLFSTVIGFILSFHEFFATAIGMYNMLILENPIAILVLFFITVIIEAVIISLFIKNKTKKIIKKSLEISFIINLVSYILIFVVISLLPIISNIYPLPIEPIKINKSDVNISNTISPSEAYAVCDEESCPIESVIVQGNMERTSTSWGIFRLYDKNETIYIDLQELNISMADIIIFQEKIKLEKGGIVEAKVRGRIFHDSFCTMRCVDIVRMIIEPKEIEIVKEVGCRDTNESRSTFEPGDCFDVSYRKISIENAYSIFFSSKVCTEKGRRPSGDFYYDKEEDRWVFGIFSITRPGGCSEGCQIYEDKVIFIRTCAVGSVGEELRLEEEVKTKSINKLYEECIKGNLDDSSKYGPARDEPVGAKRLDDKGRTWTKQADGMWTTEYETVEIIKCDTEEREGSAFKDEEGNVWTKKSSETHKTYTSFDEGIDDPVGSTRKDKDGNIWTKESKNSWYRVVTTTCWTRNETRKSSLSWGDALIDQQPGGINYGYYPIECDVYLKRSLWT